MPQISKSAVAQASKPAGLQETRLFPNRPGPADLEIGGTGQGLDKMKTHPPLSLAQGGGLTPALGAVIVAYVRGACRPKAAAESFAVQMTR